MRKVLVLTLAVLGLPAVAHAKGITHMEVCGASACREVAVSPGGHTWPGSASASAPPPRSAPYFVLVVTRDGRSVARAWYVPDVERVGWPQGAGAARPIEWRPLWEQAIDQAVRETARGLVPYPARSAPPWALTAVPRERVAVRAPDGLARTADEGGPTVSGLPRRGPTIALVAAGVALAAGLAWIALGARRRSGRHLAYSRRA